MPKNQKKQDDERRRYNSYSEKTLQKALTAIQNGRISINKASVKFNIAKGTLMNKLHGKHLKRFGASPIFTPDEEKKLAEYATTIMNWGYPFTIKDLRHLGKVYLEALGKKPSKPAADNLPGSEWANRFMERYKDNFIHFKNRNWRISKKSSPEHSLTEFFDHLQTLSDGTISRIPPDRIFNFSIVNLESDPTVSECVFKQSKKYVPCGSDSCVSVIFCGSGLGKILTPFVVFKNEKMLPDSWIEVEPKYNVIIRSNNFDPSLFLDWFKTVFIPHVRNLDGNIVLISDYSSSLFSPQVLELAEKNNIAFTCVPENVTHLCQPLESSFFNHLECNWRYLLNEWRDVNGPLPVSKVFFPTLFNQLLKATCDDDCNRSELFSVSLLNGFKECGIAPFNPSAVFVKVGSSWGGVAKSGPTIFRIEEDITLPSDSDVESPYARETSDNAFENASEENGNPKLTLQPFIIHLHPL